MALIRQQIMDAIFVRLRSITIANGYTRDVGERRVYHESELPENVPPPAILVLEGDERVSFDSTENYRCTIPLQVAFIARVKGQEAGDEVARSFMAEVQRAMGNEFEITTTGYSSGASITLTVNLYETGNSYVCDEQTAEGDVSYSVEYSRHLKDPNKI